MQNGTQIKGLKSMNNASETYETTSSSLIYVQLNSKGSERNKKYLKKKFYFLKCDPNNFPTNPKSIRNTKQNKLD